jgi:predicted nucleic acid-binding protein
LRKIAEQALEDLAQLRLTRCAVNGRAQLDMARKLNLTAYDAAYVLLAADLGAPLVTFDEALGLAAKEVLQGQA